MNLSLTVAFAASCVVLSTTGHAQTLQETAQAQVARNKLGTVAFSESVAQRLRLPSGFQVNVFASGLGQPRMMATGPDGVVYLTRRGEPGTVVALRDIDGDGRSDEVREVAKLPGVHGIDIHDGWLYLASSTTLWRMRLQPGSQPEVIVRGLPDGGQHPNRTVRVGPDGLLYVSVGSSCNDCPEENQLERGTMIRYSPDGSSRRVIAKGLRNTIGYDWHPITGALWGMDHGSDFRGDGIPPEELNLIQEGRNYGWPICYGARVIDGMSNASVDRLVFEPGASRDATPIADKAAYCARSEASSLTVEAHAAPMQMLFDRSGRFGGGTARHAFVAMRGSWNRADPVGYSVKRIVFDAKGQPMRAEDFMTGFHDPVAGIAFGRPVGLTFAADGALLVSDDTGGAIYRVTATTLGRP